MDDDGKRARGAKRGSPYLNTAQAAHYLGLHPRQLERWRAAGTGPVYRRHARHVRYHVDDLHGWSLSRATGPKS